MVRRTLLSALAIALFGSPAVAAPFYGIAIGIDGDSMRVDDKEVRLFGIDAPEFNQTCKRGGQDWSCGSEAADRLGQLVTGREVRCTSMGTDRYGRILGRCTVGVTDINRTMVATGYAVAFRRYSMDYISAEESAKAAKRGIWAGTFEMPSDVRHAVEGPNQPESSSVGRGGHGSQMPVVSSIRSQPQPGGACRIKGNRGSNGWIYHLPGMPYYNQTRAEEMFCTEAEAQAAGYRRARVR